MVHKMNIYGNVRHSNPIRDTGDELVEVVGRGAGEQRRDRFVFTGVASLRR